jgi:hypothetical protein
MPQPQSYEALKSIILQVNQHHWDEVHAENAEQKLCDHLLRDLKSKENTKSSSGHNSKKSKDSDSKKSSSESSSNAKSQEKSKDKKDSKKPFGDTSQSKDNNISKNLGHNGKLLFSIRQHNIDSNLCLLCGKLGHITPNCFKKKKKDSTSGRTAMTDAGGSEAIDALDGSKD